MIACMFFLSASTRAITQVSRLFDLLERVNEKFPPDETSNSEEARKRRRSQMIGRVIGKTDTAEVQTEETLRRVGLPMADVATWQIEAALRATGGVISKAAEKLRVSRVTLWRRIRREPHLRDVVFDCRETLLDEAEGVLWSWPGDDYAKFVKAPQLRGGCEFVGLTLATLQQPPSVRAWLPVERKSNGIL